MPMHQDPLLVRCCLSNWPVRTDRVMTAEMWLHYTSLMMVKPASNDFGCICEQSWKDQRNMEVYITINRTNGRWRLCGNDQQCLAAPIWKYRSGFGDHRFTYFVDLLPNYTFYTNLTNIVYWVVVYRDVAHLITLNLGKVEKRYAKSFDAGLKYTEPQPQGKQAVRM